MLRQRLSEAANWFDKAARVAKRPIDVYDARLGAGFVAMLERKGDLAAWELEVAARVAAISSSEREFGRQDIHRAPDGDDNIDRIRHPARSASCYLMA